MGVVNAALPGAGGGGAGEGWTGDCAISVAGVVVGVCPRLGDSETGGGVGGSSVRGPDVVGESCGVVP